MFEIITIFTLQNVQKNYMLFAELKNKEINKNFMNINFMKCLIGRFLIPKFKRQFHRIYI